MNSLALENEKWKQIFKEMIDSYEHIVDQYYDRSLKLFPQREINYFIKHIKNRGKILDVGCGPGRDAHIFTYNKFKVIGIDASEKMIKHASLLLPNARFIQCDLLNLPIKANPTFDGIWCSAIFLHIPHELLITTLSNLYKLGKNNAILYISVKEGRGEKFLPDYRYNGGKKFWSFYEQADIVKGVVSANFRIIDSYVTDSLNGVNLDNTKWVTAFAKKEN